jgi:hypothetical protein
VVAKYGMMCIRCMLKAVEDIWKGGEISSIRALGTVMEVLFNMRKGKIYTEA